MEATISKASIKARKMTRATNANMRVEFMRLRSLMIGLAGKDEEGDYRPEFVERALKAAEDTSTHIFKSPADFLKQVRAV